MRTRALAALHAHGQARLLIERHEAKRGEGENEEGRHGSSDSDEDSDDDEDDDEYECGPGRWPPPRRAKKAARRSKSTSGGGGGGGPSGSAARGPAVEIAPGHLRLSSNVRLGGGGGTQVWLGRLCVPQAPPVAVMVRGVRLVGQASSNPRSRPHLANLKAKLLLTLDAARGCRQVCVRSWWGRTDQTPRSATSFATSSERALLACVARSCSSTWA